ncbi:MAG: DUF89 family protein [Erysipelotrichaceae bacterium]|nr:DUF89 family protein [Erysipelotrichaceae bacterium]
MRIIESCAACLYDKQKHITDDEEYLAEVRRIIDERRENDASPYLVHLFDLAYRKRFGVSASYREIKRKYNDLVLSMEDSIRKKIEKADDPLSESLVYARIGNYIDFGAMNYVDDETFLSLFDNVAVHQRDKETMESFVRQCAEARSFLLLTDNCGEIVLDKLFLEQLRKRFPKLKITVMVRGREVINDATIEDAEYVGLDKVAEIVTNGDAVAGTIYEMLPKEAKEVLDSADVILAKGQGNYESLCRQGRHIFYSFLCKCELFMARFNVPQFTGIFVEENH